jgi:hypothetical protein
MAPLFLNTANMKNLRNGVSVSSYTGFRASYARSDDSRAVPPRVCHKSFYNCVPESPDWNSVRSLVQDKGADTGGHRVLVAPDFHWPPYRSLPNPMYQYSVVDRSLATPGNVLKPSVTSCRRRYICTNYPKFEYWVIWCLQGTNIVADSNRFAQCS